MPANNTWVELGYYPPTWQILPRINFVGLSSYNELDTHLICAWHSLDFFLFPSLSSPLSLPSSSRGLPIVIQYFKYIVYSAALLNWQHLVTADVLVIFCFSHSRVGTFENIRHEGSEQWWANLRLNSLVIVQKGPPPGEWEMFQVRLGRRALYRSLQSVHSVFASVTPTLGVSIIQLRVDYLK